MEITDDDLERYRMCSDALMCTQCDPVRRQKCIVIMERNIAQSIANQRGAHFEPEELII